MTRGQKKFLYGLFYFIILGLIVWAFVPSPKNPAPICSGLSCGTNQPLSLQVSGVPQIFISESTHRIVLLGQVTNPNPDFGAQTFSFDFIIFNRDGTTIASVPGTGKIYPSETRYVLNVYDAGNLDLSLVDSERPGLEFKNADFRPATEFLKPNLILTSGPETNVSSEGIKVTGRIKNQSASLTGMIKVISILEGKYEPAFAAQTLIQGLGGFEEAPFEINLPADPIIISKMDPAKTAILLSEE